MSLIVKRRKQVRDILLDESQAKHQLPQYQNQHKYFIDRYGKRMKTWEAPVKSAYDRPIKKVKYDLWSDSRSIWPER